MDKNCVERDISQQRKKRGIIITVIALISLIAIMAILVSVLENSTSEPERQFETAAPIDKDKLSPKKPEGFDIMEYDEYLRYDRSVYYNDKNTGVRVSVNDASYNTYNDGFTIMYEVIKAINNGDYSVYNEYMGNKSLKKRSFTQQQIYDIIVSPYSRRDISGENNIYTEYVFEVKFKIHENNGSYRNNIESDAARPLYFVINNSLGEYKVMDILEKKYEVK